MRFGSWPARWILLGGLCLLGMTGCGSDDKTDAPESGSATDTAADRETAQRFARHEKLVAGLPDFTDLVRQVSPSVVNISARPAQSASDADKSIEHPSAQARGPGDSMASPLRDWLQQFFGHDEQDREQAPEDANPDHKQDSLGSGVIMSEDGYILTSRHVVADAEQITVKLHDRRQLKAKVVGEDPGSDIAVLKIKADDLPAARLGDARQMSVGAWVVAIGSPFGFETSVTAGILSAKQRSLEDAQYVPFLQTDAAINPGNSGGPLFNLAGEVIGINSQILSETGGNQGISFAIPINVAAQVAKQLRQQGRVTRGWLGVQVQTVDRAMARSFQLKQPEGALVSHILPDSPADEGKLKTGDVILAIDDQPVDKAADLPPLVAPLTPGTRIQVKLIRNGKSRTETLKVAALPDKYAQGAEAKSSPQAQGRDFGLVLSRLHKKDREELDIKQGVLVKQVTGEPAQTAKLQPGDVILGVNTTDVNSPEQLLAELRRAEGKIALLIMRDGVRLYLPMDGGKSK